MNFKLKILILSIGLAVLCFSCRQSSDKVNPESLRAVRNVTRIEWPKEVVFTNILDNWLDGLIAAEFKVFPSDVEKILEQGEFHPISAEQKEKLLKYHASLNPIDSVAQWRRDDGNSCVLEMYINKNTGLGHLRYSGRGAIGD